MADLLPPQRTYEVVMNGKAIKFEYETDDPYRSPSAALARPVIAPPVAPKIEPAKPVLTIIPPFVRATYEYPLGKYLFKGYLVEIPPAVRMLTYDWAGRYSADGGEETYLVALPWTYLVFTTVSRGAPAHLSTYSAYWANHRVKDTNSPLWRAHLPNVYDSGGVCIGTSLGTDRESSDPAVLALAFFNKFYGSIFNDHATGTLNMPDKYGSGRDGMKKWVQDSEADNFCYLSWAEFKGQSFTVQSRFDKACGPNW